MKTDGHFVKGTQVDTVNVKVISQQRLSTGLKNWCKYNLDFLFMTVKG